MCRNLHFWIDHLNRASKLRLNEPPVGVEDEDPPRS